ncbi:MAG: Two component regulator three Y domain-containing protein [Maribacter sp.]|nr:MAG: Two component regulator three Y domain-containing protein [Maribacter sp.]
MKQILAFFISVLITPLWLGGQNLLPPVKNYKAFEYNAASKNWGLAVDQDGELYVANNAGLLHYNGERWTLNKLPNKTIIRSVASVGDRVYTGSYEEFGYWVKNNVGLLEYTSLTHLIKGHEFTSEEFWEILPYGERIIFKSFPAIYIYEDNRITMVNLDMIVSDIVAYNGKVIVAGDRGGLYELVNNELISLGNPGFLEGKAITDMVETPEGLLIGTKLNGCYLYKENSLIPWEEKINNELRLHQLNKMLVLTNGKIVFGTIKNGIYLYDPVKNHYEVLNMRVGLQNNTVLSMLQFNEQLWVGLDNGIDRIQLDNPLTYYKDFSGVVGTVYDMAVHNNLLYMGSNTGIYYFKGDDLRFMEGSQGHVWDLEVIDGDLFCGHNTGTFVINKETIRKISDISGGYQIVKIPGTESAFLQGTYTGIAKYQKDKNGDWIVTKVPGGLDFPVKYLCFENDRTIWVAHPYKGLYRVTLNTGRNQVLGFREFKNDVIPNNYNIKLYNIKNQIVLYSEGLWYRYDPLQGKILVLEDFRIYENKNIAHTDDDFFWFIDDENGGPKEVVYSNLKEKHLVLDDVQLQERLAPEAENIVKLNDSIYFFMLHDGFGKLDLSKFRDHLKDFELPVPKLYAFEDNELKYPLNGQPFEIPYETSRYLTINVSAASMFQPKYHYELNGAMKQTSNIDSGTISFQNLPFGYYELDISTTSIDNQRSLPNKITFQIAPPWYLSKLSLVFYVLILLGVFWTIRWYNRRKLERKHYRLKLRLQKEQKEQLALLEKEKLEKEIKLKQKELARTTLNIAEKNKIILELKEMLLVNKNQFSSQKRFQSFMKKLDNSINDDGDWKLFEVNFKELHEDFFENLLKKYPKLTPKDLKLCAYLKMNLSSKEIAPLMAITNRGVEIHRYRLRKKLKIDSSQNLSNFLIKFN